MAFVGKEVVVPGSVLATGGIVAKFVGVTATTVVATPNVSWPQAPTVVLNTAIVIALAKIDPTLGHHFLDIDVCDTAVCDVGERLRTRKQSRSLCPPRGGALTTFIRHLQPPLRVVYDNGRAVGSIGYGNIVDPIKYSSTPDAHARPSAIAQTIRLWPLPMSPATNTPGTDVM